MNVYRFRVDVGDMIGWVPGNLFIKNNASTTAQKVAITHLSNPSGNYEI